MVTRIYMVILYLYSIYNWNWEGPGFYFAFAPGLNARFIDWKSFPFFDFFLAFVKKPVLRENVLPDNVTASSKFEGFENMDFTESDSDLGGDMEILRMDMSREGTIGFYNVL